MMSKEDNLFVGLFVCGFCFVFVLVRTKNICFDGLDFHNVQDSDVVTEKILLI